MTARKDILKPIIMFSSHADPIAPKLIINELRSLYDKGYKVICLELDKQKPVNYFLNQLKALEKAIEKEGAVRDSISALKTLIIEGRKIGFKFANIDPQSLN
ncbi:hypothetical protein I862_04940 [endosymbiont of Acanthamoeba sp. UWC8]|uniref:hypothetical protein n=1 Tax=endosymbiont of Acanthamoeba sp. UWC8 TaxID=86106 RepID=UPI0004D1E961|nr:hypothetical protein [endosymbiont of Acanthamoeba sp. UWC8]AIF81544.1 hypothetical protein I862_04940 [endosymbiont of Acanthamoeba sp. UWC8]